ncbi:MAG: N-6 DNA methylase, partial [Candidatus Nealsonbacteria bacterium]|nr:N-6 DNA methylase [Candidatus Nealsonbacteria bacterium]
WKQLKEKTFYGYDFDSTMVRIGLMNLILHSIPYPNISRKDTLSKKYNEDNKYDVILANPPFKGSIDEGDINEGFSLDTTKTELLFVNRIINSLRIGGRAGVIVPDGVLFGSSRAHKDLRTMLIEKCELQGVISMPSGVFKPYAGVSEKVWFYNMQTDGYTLDDKREKIEANDLPDIIKEWKVRNKNANNVRKAKHFFVPVKEIIENDYDLSINRYKEINYQSVKYDKPEKILYNIKKKKKDIQKGIKDLKDLL